MVHWPPRVLCRIAACLELVGGPRSLATWEGRGDGDGFRQGRRGPATRFRSPAKEGGRGADGIGGVVVGGIGPEALEVVPVGGAAGWLAGSWFAWRGSFALPGRGGLESLLGPIRASPLALLRCFSRDPSRLQSSPLAWHYDLLWLVCSLSGWSLADTEATFFSARFSLTTRWEGIGSMAAGRKIKVARDAPNCGT